MSLLYFWRGENYLSDVAHVDPAIGLRLQQNSPRFGAARSGEALWTFTRRSDGTYVLAAFLRVARVEDHALDNEYGRYTAVPEPGSTILFDIEQGEDIEPLIRSLSQAPQAAVLGRSFQGHGAVRELTSEDERKLQEFATRQPLRSRAGDSDWKTIRAAARKALQSRAEFLSPKRGVRYRIELVEPERVAVARLDANEPAVLTQRLVSRSLERLRAAGGRISRTGLSPTVAEETAIVYLHPGLQWDSSADLIVWSPEGWGEPRRVYRDFGEAPNDDPAEIQSFARRVRRGQRRFRQNLIQAYGSLCAISGWGPEEVLEAAHINPHSRSGINSLDNGLLLRADLHTLFDERWIRIHPETLELHVDERLRRSEYWRFHGHVLRERIDGGRPAEDHLRHHWYHSR